VEHAADAGGRIAALVLRAAGGTAALGLGRIAEGNADATNADVAAATGRVAVLVLTHAFDANLAGGTRAVADSVATVAVAAGRARAVRLAAALADASGAARAATSPVAAVRDAAAACVARRGAALLADASGSARAAEGSGAAVGDPAAAGVAGRGAADVAGVAQLHAAGALGTAFAGPPAAIWIAADLARAVGHAAVAGIAGPRGAGAGTPASVGAAAGSGVTRGSAAGHAAVERHAVPRAAELADLSAPVGLATGIGQAVRRALALAEHADPGVAGGRAAGVEALPVAAEEAGLTGHQCAGVVPAGARGADLPAVADDGVTRIRLHAEQSAGMPRGAAAVTRAERDALAGTRLAELLGRAGDPGAEVPEATRDASALDAGLVLGAAHPGAGIHDRHAGGEAHAGVAEARRARIRLAVARQADAAIAVGIPVADGRTGIHRTCIAAPGASSGGSA